jgi:putative transposase
MPREKRIVVPGTVHHVTQRGNHRQQIFFSDADRRLYLDLVSESAEAAQVELWGWCLMSNHVHWLVLPKTMQGLARLFRRAHGEYARHRHRLRRTTGHFWQARYYSCPLDGQHVWRALAYVERNPVRAGLVSTAEQYSWSSARVRLALSGEPEWLNVERWRREFDADDWRHVLATSIADGALRNRIREATLAGKPLGDEHFVRRLSHEFDRCMEIRPRGRPSGTKVLSG